MSEILESAGFIVGGLAIFLYGINIMSEGLKTMAGNKIRDYIEKYTSNLILAILVGTLATALLHSSTAVTVISISLVRAGLMKLKQAIGITIGANIGTCITAIMVGFDIEKAAYFIVAIGVALLLLGRKKNQRLLGQIVLGFGLLFAGLQILSGPLEVAAQTPWFAEAMAFMGKYPWVALLGGTIATAVMNSSTAVITIVQLLFSTGVIAPAAAVAFVFGSNVGTTLTAVLVGAGGSPSSKRAAMFHVVYNIAGALLGMIFLHPFISLTNMFASQTANPEMWVAQTHLLFNVISTVLVIPFVNPFVKLLEWMIPGEDRGGAKIESIDELDYALIKTLPAGALEVANKNVCRMGRNVLENVKLSRKYLHSHDPEDFDEVMEIEAVVNNYDTKLTHYLSKIAQNNNLNKEQQKEYSKNYQVVKNLERMSDLTTNLVEFYRMAYDEREKFSEEAVHDLERMYDRVELMIPKAMTIFETNSQELYQSLCDDEDLLNYFEYEARENHFDRIVNVNCIDKVASSVYADILSNVERIGDHCLNISRVTIFGGVYHDEKAKMLSRNLEPEELREALENELHKA